MSSTAFDDLSFAEPSSISSRQFLTQSYVQHPSDGVGRFYSPGQQTRIEISGQSQNSFVLPRTLKLHYHHISQPQIFDSAGPTATDGQQLFGRMDVNACDGVPFFGAPHLSVVQTEIPGLSSQMSPLVSDGYSQLMYASRLICSGDSGRLEVPGDLHTYTADGQAYEAGGRGVIQRAGAVKGASWRADYSASPNVTMEDRWGGAFKQVSVPASAWFSLCDGASSVLPLPYLTSASSNLLVNMTWAPATSALCNSLRPRGVDLLTYKATGVHLGWTAVNVVDAEILARVQKLFRGQVTLPIMDGVSIPVPMTLSHRAYKCAATTLSSATGSVSLRIPAGVAAANAIMVRVMPEDGAVADASDATYQPAGKFASQHLVGVKPIITDMQIEIGSARFPSRPISDVYYASGIVPPGLSSAKWALNVTSAGDSRNDDVGGATYIPTSDSQAADAYRLGRMHFSLFDDDRFQACPAAPLFEGVGDYSDIVDKTSSLGFVDLAVTGSLAYRPLSGAARSTRSGLFRQVSPNLFIFNLQSLLQEQSLRERGFQISGVDLRNQADVTLSFNILGTAPAGANAVTSTSVNSVSQVGNPLVSSWRTTAFMSYSELACVLPGRVDLSSSLSLLPSAAGSVASSG